MSPTAAFESPSRVALRTYVLGLSFSAVPALLPLIAAYVTAKSSKDAQNRRTKLVAVLRREFGPSGFAFAMAAAAGGGRLLDHLWHQYSRKGKEKKHPIVESRVDEEVTHDTDGWVNTFICNLVSTSLAISLLHSKAGRVRTNTATPFTPPLNPSRGTGRSPTLDLTLLFLVRALDGALHGALVPKKLDDTSSRSESGLAKRKRLFERISKIDALVFWAASARIMWCYFYEPHRLPRTYVKWISSLASIDPRILEALRAIRSRTWLYGKRSTAHPTLLTSLSSDLGYPSQWGDPTKLPKYGGAAATMTWKSLGLTSRNGLGGIPCEVVHGGVGGDSCLANSGIRGFNAFCKALLIYLPVHLLPALLVRPTVIISDPFHIIGPLLRSSSFLATFVSTIWFFVCFTRTLCLARILPFISHNFWDGPFGCTFAGSMLCGASIFLEQGRRRAEMGLYVLPRAVRTLLSDHWVRKGGLSVRITERLTFILSLAYLLTISVHSPGRLRGLSRWTLAFIMKGPKAGFWYRRRQEKHVEAPS
ncbi:hypothetical protein SISNIDRAFT_549988 [Sistotremastrum niveocremeum HHB9708]|uniref:Transmembrane protein 135 N-terminal domain-containing protein n=1 Tax=Sistotremastrum niveocremeum HHB9708 TaxID=1314777 RepID=A0A164U6F9_9AGAM|nr:hypothetical protein SISNIDRAFT_549988 [Sistotremastrum niveocremeum HHB9708]